MSLQNGNIYKLKLKEGIERFLHSINLNPASNLYGVADREYWAWKTKDFANGTWQGGIAGLLDAKDLLPFSDKEIKICVKALITGTHKVQRNNGSFEESYPYESSYCVTALVLSNLLYSYFSYSNLFDNDDKKIIRLIVEKSYDLLKKSKETHGVISNHLCTALCAKLLAEKFFDLPHSRGELLDFCNLQHSKENWFPEYGGADPGYQTLLNHYLIATLQILDLPELKKTLDKSLSFIQDFCFPNRSYSGETGNRGTSILYPSGTLYSPASNWFIENYAENIESVTPINVDSGNFVPVFNSWAFFYKHRKIADKKTTLSKIKKKEYPDAGLLIYKTPESMLIISKKQSVLRKVDLINKQYVDASIVGFKKGNFTTQGTYLQSCVHKRDFIELTFNERKLSEITNGPIKSIIVRITSILIYCFPLLQRLFKTVLKTIIMSESKPSNSGIKVKIYLNKPKLPVKVYGADGWKRLKYGYHSHMASANTFSKRALHNDSEN